MNKINLEAIWVYLFISFSYPAIFRVCLAQRLNLCLIKFHFFLAKIECGLYFLDRFDVLISKIIFKKWKNIIGMYFSTKSYLKSNHYHTIKHLQCRITRRGLLLIINYHELKKESEFPLRKNIYMGEEVCVCVYIYIYIYIYIVFSWLYNIYEEVYII